VKRRFSASGLSSKNGQRVDAKRIWDYLSEIARSWLSNPLMENKVFREFGAVCALAGLLSSCAVREAVNVPAPVAAVAPAPPPKPTALTAEAAAALLAAEQSVTEARIKRSLWTKAVQHLEQARAAAKIFDSEATLMHAKETIALCELSVAQLKSPPVRW
jgi:hypothetical protein